MKKTKATKPIVTKEMVLISEFMDSKYYPVLTNILDAEINGKAVLLSKIDLEKHTIIAAKYQGRMAVCVEIKNIFEKVKQIVEGPGPKRMRPSRDPRSKNLPVEA